MNEIKDRIIELRKALKLSQMSFGKEIGLSRSSVQNLEYDGSITERTIMLICEKFGVNRDWLTSGTGEMFAENKNVLNGRFADEYAKGGAFKTFVDVFLGLTDAQREVINEVMDEYVRARAAALQSGSAEPELLDVSIQTAAFLEKLHESGQEEA